MEEPWAEAWRRLPLVLHDRDLAEAVQIHLLVEAEDDVKLKQVDDFTETISKVLKKHPGPIQYLRLDRTACPGPDLLRAWVDTMSGKGVQELVLLNLMGVEQQEFPLDRLRSRSLTTLALGFFGLAALGLDWCDDHAASLQRLDLAGCSFSGRDLSAVVCSLPRLSTLTVGCCDVTAACGREGLEIVSRTLRSIHIWNCTASAVTLVDTPSLKVFIVGVSPEPGRAALLIDLQSAQALQELHHLALHWHILRMCSNAAVRFDRRWVMSLPFLATLDISIRVCAPGQASVLVQLLGNLPRLVELIIWRIDDLSAQGDHEACRKAWSLHLVPPCIISSLEQLTVRCYRGGGGELALVGRVLSTARKLMSITLHPHQSVPLEAATTAIFDGCPVASKECKLLMGLREG